MSIHLRGDTSRPTTTKWERTANGSLSGAPRLYCVETGAVLGKVEPVSGRGWRYDDFRFESLDETNLTSAGHAAKVVFMTKADAMLHAELRLLAEREANDRAEEARREFAEIAASKTTGRAGLDWVEGVISVLVVLALFSGAWVVWRMFRAG